ncbi:MAG: prepilin-type N-terminal cleavage/methylation domain-containing protein [Gemmatimonadota bacterium]
MSIRSTTGSTLVELMISLTILSIGVLGLIGTAAAVTRLLGQGHWSTVAAMTAERRIEMLRAIAVDSATCASLSGGSQPMAGGLTEAWTVSPGPSTEIVMITVSGAGSRVDSISATLPCR